MHVVIFFKEKSHSEMGTLECVYFQPEFKTFHYIFTYLLVLLRDLKIYFFSFSSLIFFFLMMLLLAFIFKGEAFFHGSTVHYKKVLVIFVVCAIVFCILSFLTKKYQVKFIPLVPLDKRHQFCHVTHMYFTDQNAFLLTSVDCEKQIIIGELLFVKGTYCENLKLIRPRFN